MVLRDRRLSISRHDVWYRRAGKIIFQIADTVTNDVWIFTGNSSYILATWQISAFYQEKESSHGSRYRLLGHCHVCDVTINCERRQGVSKSLYISVFIKRRRRWIKRCVFYMYSVHVFLCYNDHWTCPYMAGYGMLFSDAKTCHYEDGIRTVTTKYKYNIKLEFVFHLCSPFNSLRYFYSIFPN